MEEKPERRAFVRLPVTLFVDSIEFEPTTYIGVETIRTAYDLEITEYDARTLYKKLQERFEKYPMTPIRIRVIGRLVS